MSEYKQGDKVIVTEDSSFFKKGEVTEVARPSKIPGLIYLKSGSPEGDDPVVLSKIRPYAEDDAEDEPKGEDTADFERVAAEQDRMEEEAEADAMIAQHERELHEGVGTQDHYMSCKIQPIDFITENGMDFLEGNVIKYVARYKRKNGLEDLQKAHQYLTWLIEREERKDAEA